MSAAAARMSVARELAQWAFELAPTADDHLLAARALTDTVAVAIAARDHPVMRVATQLSDAGRWAVASHALDFDDLHVPSTTHISAVCVPAVVASGGDARAYLAAAGVMARVGNALGWSHYTAGWHATCTAGALAAAVGAGMGLGLDARRMETAIALAVPAAGGTHRAFGSDAKSLQVGFAAEAGVRAARLAAAGAQAEPTALDAWLPLVGGDRARLDLRGPAIPDGLAMKLFPCCYALQRPLSLLSELRRGIDPARVTRVTIRTPAAAATPLVYHRPETGEQAKFSLEYAMAAALLDEHVGFDSFTDQAVRRPQARRLMNLVEVHLTPDGEGLLAGECEAELIVDGQARRGRLDHPPGSPRRPPSSAEAAGKFHDCVAGVDIDVTSIDWPTAGAILRRHC